MTATTLPGSPVAGLHAVELGPADVPLLQSFVEANPAYFEPAPLHIAFTAENRQQVQDFHRAALAAGAQDNGGPALRPHYHPNYYGAFVIGSDGHNLEAVCHRPEA